VFILKRTVHFRLVISQDSLEISYWTSNDALHTFFYNRAATNWGWFGRTVNSQLAKISKIYGVAG